ncbi:hypothetical protein RND71_019303 [Anisodus tanguticus]|uniref:Uncharacterized protein n=1 Tax=Anisodus tanguticus TaxID=243964 RepID=A0AAE1S0N1_9SOLA|nr:hypothetical protein RND71_019303 [Anisodus tanguticus]
MRAQQAARQARFKDDEAIARYNHGMKRLRLILSGNKKKIHIQLAILVASLMEYFPIDVRRTIVIEILPREVSQKDTSYLFPITLTRLMMDNHVPKLSKFDKLTTPKKVIDIFRSQDDDNPALRKRKADDVTC